VARTNTASKQYLASTQSLTDGHVSLNTDAAYAYTIITRQSGTKTPHNQDTLAVTKVSDGQSDK